MKNLLIIFIILFQLSSHAQEKWDLQKCIDYAIRHNPKILSQKTRIKIDSLNLKTQQYDRLPKIDFTAHQAYQLGNTYNVSTGVGQKQSSFTNFNLSAQMSLFNAWQKKYQILYQKNLRDKNQYQYDDAVWQLKSDIINTFFQVLYERENLSNITYLIDTQKEQITILEKLYQKQLKPFEDILSAQIDLKKLQLQEQEARKQNRYYTQKLLDLLHLNQQDIQIDKDIPWHLSVMDTTQIKIENTPRLLALLQEISNLETAKKIEISKKYPHVFFNYSFGSNYYHLLGQDDLIYNQQTGNLEPNGFWTQLKNNRLHYLSVGVSIPIFNGLKTKNKIKELTYKQQIARYDYQSEKQKLTGLYKQLLNEINQASKQYNTQKEIFDLTKKSYLLKKEKYINNMINYIEWQQIKNNYNKALSKVLQAKYTLLLKQVSYYKLFESLPK